MKTRYGIAIFALAIVQLFAQAGLAQTYFENRAKNKAAARVYSGSSGMNEVTGRDGVVDNRLWSSGSADPSLYCGNGECTGVVVVPTPARGTTLDGVTVPGPMRGHFEATGSTAYPSQDVAELNGPWTNLAIMWEYLDSGVSGGAFKTYNKANGVFANRMLALGTTLKQLDYMPEVRDVAAAGIIGCIRQQQANGSWTHATSACLEDQSMYAGAVFQQPAGTQVNWMSTHPEYPGSGGTQTTMLLSDMLMEPLRRQSGTAADELKASWTALFGDKVFVMPTGTAPGAPKTVTVTVQLPTKSVEQLHYEIHNTAWTKLHELMRAYCEYNKGASSEQANNHIPFSYQLLGFFWGHPIFGPSSRDFWGNLGKTYGGGTTGPTQQTFIDLTTSTFEFTPVVGDALFSLFLKTQDIKPNSGGGSVAPNEYACDELKSQAANDHSNYSYISKMPQLRALPWRKMYDQVTQIIAAGRRYDIYSDAKRFIDQQTASGTDGDLVRDHAMSLIIPVLAPFESGAEAQEGIAKSAQLFLEELNRRIQVETGSLGSQIAAGISGGAGSSQGRGAGSPSGS